MVTYFLSSLTRAQKKHMSLQVINLWFTAVDSSLIWEFPKIRGSFFWVLIIRILLFGVLY